MSVRGTSLDPSRTNSVEPLLIVAVVIWAANYPVSKYGLSGIDVLVFNSLRFLVASAALVAYFLKRFHWSPVSPPDRGRVLSVGVLSNVIYQIAFVSGLSLTTSGNAAVLLSTSPLWTVLFEARLNKQKIPRGMLIGMAMSLCGVVMIIAGSGKRLELGSTALYGDLICLAAAALSGLSTNLQKPFLSRYSVPQLTLLFTVIGAVGLTIVAIPAAIRTPWAAIHWSYYAATLASGAFSIAIAGLFWSRGIKELGPARAANFNNLVPVLAFIFSYLVLDEAVVRVQVVGAIVTIAGVWYARRS